MSLSDIQQALRAAGIPGWLFYDFRGSDPLAASILGLQPAHRSRRWFYLLPADGEPTKIVHAIERSALASLPGRERVYLAWEELHRVLAETLAGCKQVAMQYSPENDIPYVSRVDAGTVELIRSLGVEVVSSADLVQQFEARLSPAQHQSHLVAADALGAAVMDTFKELERRLKAGTPTTEYELQQWLWNRFAEDGMIADHPPIVGVDAHSADPHYEPTPQNSAAMQPEMFVLIDAWCKSRQPGSIYADITWVGWTGTQPPAEQRRVFEIVRDARDAAVKFVVDGLAGGRTVRGCDVDNACRGVIRAAGFGEQFIHRTGHSVHENVHGNGANIDNLETRDERSLIPRTCFTVEPGIYLPGRFGVRSELNVYVVDERSAVVTGLVPQREILCWA